MSSKSEKPREFTIYDSQGEGLKAILKSGTALHPIEDVVHVIEFSAYEALQKELTGLRELNKKQADTIQDIDVMNYKLQAQLAETEDRIWDMEHNEAVLLRDLDEARTRLAEAQGENERLKQAMAFANSKLKPVAEAYEKLEAERDSLKAEVESLKAKYHDASVEIDRKRGIILKLREGLEKIQQYPRTDKYFDSSGAINMQLMANETLAAVAEMEGK